MAFTKGSLYILVILSIEIIHKFKETAIIYLGFISTDYNLTLFRETKVLWEMVLDHLPVVGIIEINESTSTNWALLCAGDFAEAGTPKPDRTRPQGTHNLDCSLHLLYSQQSLHQAPAYFQTLLPLKIHLGLDLTTFPDSLSWTFPGFKACNCLLSKSCGPRLSRLPTCVLSQDWKRSEAFLCSCSAM